MTTISQRHKRKMNKVDEVNDISFIQCSCGSWASGVCEGTVSAEEKFNEHKASEANREARAEKRAAKKKG